MKFYKMNRTQIKKQDTVRILEIPIMPTFSYSPQVTTNLISNTKDWFCLCLNLYINQIIHAYFHV